MADDLKRYRQNEVPKAYTPSLGNKLSRWSKNRWRVTAICSMLSIVLAALLIWKFWPHQSGNQHLSTATPPALTHTVVIPVHPIGSRIVVVPFDSKTGQPNVAKAIVPPPSDVYQIELEPGKYIIEATYRDDDILLIKEVIRMVPETVSQSPVLPARTMLYKCLTFRVDSQNRVILP